MLIEAVRQHPIIFEVSSRKFKDIQGKTSAWEAISASVGTPVETVKTRYNSLKRDYFNYKKSSQLPSGSANVTRPSATRLSVYSRMTFLDKFYSPRQSTSNIRPLIVEDENENIPPDETTPIAISTTTTPIANSTTTTPTAVNLKRSRTGSQKDSLDEILSEITSQLKESSSDEYASFGSAIGDGIRRLDSQIAKDYAMFHLRSELYKIQLNGVPRDIQLPRVPQQEPSTYMQLSRVPQQEPSAYMQMLQCDRGAPNHPEEYFN